MEFWQKLSSITEFHKYKFPRPLGESGFADEWSKASSDSEQIERNARKRKKRNSVSVEQVQDGSSCMRNVVSITTAGEG